jgi:hypothetical protein
MVSLASSIIQYGNSRGTWRIYHSRRESETIETGDGEAVFFAVPLQVDLFAGNFQAVVPNLSLVSVFAIARGYNASCRLRRRCLLQMFTEPSRLSDYILESVQWDLLLLPCFLDLLQFK